MNTVATILQEIADGVGRIVTWLFSSKDEQTREQRLAADKILADRQKELTDKIQKIGEDKSKPAEQRKAELERLRKERGSLTSARAELTTGKAAVGGISTTDPKEIAKQAMLRIDLGDLPPGAVVFEKGYDEALEAHVQKYIEENTGAFGLFKPDREAALKYAKQKVSEEAIAPVPTFGRIFEPMTETLKEIEKNTSKNATPIVGVPAPSKPPANDLLVQFGENGPKWSQRVDNKDVATVSKPGGALSKIGGGSVINTVVHNHFYNEGKGIFNSMLKWNRAMGNR